MNFSLYKFNVGFIAALYYTGTGKKFLININFIKIYLLPDTHKTDILKDN